MLLFNERSVLMQELIRPFCRVFRFVFGRFGVFSEVAEEEQNIQSKNKRCAVLESMDTVYQNFM